MVDLFADQEDGEQAGGERPALSLGNVVDVLHPLQIILLRFVAAVSPMIVPVLGVDGEGLLEDEEGLVDLVAYLAGKAEETTGGFRFVIGHVGHGRGYVGGRETHGCFPA